MAAGLFLDLTDRGLFSRFTALDVSLWQHPGRRIAASAHDQVLGAVVGFAVDHAAGVCIGTFGDHGRWRGSAQRQGFAGRVWLPRAEEDLPAECLVARLSPQRIHERVDFDEYRVAVEFRVNAIE